MIPWPTLCLILLVVAVCALAYARRIKEENAELEEESDYERDKRQRAIPMKHSKGEAALMAQLDQAGIKYMREQCFHLLRKWRLDFIITEVGEKTIWDSVDCVNMSRLAVEVEGGTWSSGRHTRGAGFAADCEKYNEATLAGYRVLRVTTQQAEDGTALALVQRALKGGE